MTTTPTAGVIGIPSGLKEAGQRVDFKPDQYDLLIETKGYRLAWSRAAPCPCAPINDQTEQVDPNCSLCHGHGWIYYGNSEELDTSVVGEINETQQAIIDQDNAYVIRGILSQLEHEYEPDEKISSWAFGTSKVTVRKDNKLGYYDKLVHLDSEICYSEVIEAVSQTDLLEARYLMTGVNLLRSETTVYEGDVHFKLNAGKIEWINSSLAPASGTKLAVHYLMHPTWIVINYPHMLRTSPVKYKTVTPKTPQGDPRALPIQAMIKYDFLL